MRQCISVMVRTKGGLRWEVKVPDSRVSAKAVQVAERGAEAYWPGDVPVDVREMYRYAQREEELRR